MKDLNHLDFLWPLGLGIVCGVIASYGFIMGMNSSYRKWADREIEHLRDEIARRNR